jgi:acyl carrier protein
MAMRCLLVLFAAGMLLMNGCGNRPSVQTSASSASSATLEQVRDAASEVFDVPRSEIDAETSLADLGADELDFVELIMDLEERCDVSIPDDQAEQLLGPEGGNAGMAKVTMAKLAETVDRQK